MKDLKEIWMKGEFNQTSAFELRKEIIEHSKYSKTMPIVIYINSYGGQVDALNSILDTIHSIPNKIVTVCAGTAMSCGAVLLACGDERYIGSNSRVMIHQVSSVAWGTTQEIKSSVKEIDKLNSQLIKILAKKTRKSYKEIKKIFNTNIDKYFSAEQSKKFGLVDKIGTPRLVEEINYKLI